MQRKHTTGRCNPLRLLRGGHLLPRLGHGRLTDPRPITEITVMPEPRFAWLLQTGVTVISVMGQRRV